MVAADLGEAVTDLGEAGEVVTHFGGGGFGGHAFGRGGFGGHGFSRSFASVSVGRFGSGARGARGFADRRFFGRVNGRRFGDRGFRDRRFRGFDRGFFDFGFGGFGCPYYYRYDYSYYYPNDYSYYYPYSEDSSGANLGADNSVAGQSRKSDEMASLVQAALAKRGYDPGPIDGIIGVRSRRAIRSFQSVQGLPVTGSIDSKLIETLRIG